MKAEELLDAALGRRERDADSDGFEESTDDEPISTDRLNRLRLRVNSLLDDGESFEPPPGLANRTIRFVLDQAESHSRRVLQFESARSPGPRWPDYAVAAGIFLAGVITLIPAIQRGQFRAHQSTCSLNLNRLGVALAQYSGTYGVYPYVEQDSPAARVGSYVVLLNDEGLLPELTTLDCPADGHKDATGSLPSFKTFAANEAKAPLSSPCLCQVDYAYHLGYRRPSGKAGPLTAHLGSHLQGVVPVLADQPAHDIHGYILAGNSPNHGGRGQNVLFADGSVRWHSGRRVSPIDDDLYLNDLAKSAPGVNSRDAVLAPGTASFHGK